MNDDTETNSVSTTIPTWAKEGDMLFVHGIHEKYMDGYIRAGWKLWENQDGICSFWTTVTAEDCADD